VEDAEREALPPTPVATKLDVTGDEGDDFFGDEDPSLGVQQISENGDEEVDFGGDGFVGDGWNDDNEIPLDDEDLFDDVPIPQEQDVQEEESNAIIGPAHEPTMEEPHDIEQTTDGNQAHGASLDAPKDDNIGLSETRNAYFSGETTETESASMGDAPEINDDQIITNGLEDVANDNIMAQENIMPTATDIGDDDQAEHFVSLPPPTNTLTESNPSSMDDAEKLQYLETISQLESQLYQREDQLASKSSQITSLTLQHESDITSLRQIISETKEEARKRIVRAKERVEEMQTKLSDAVRRADAAGGSSAEQSGLVAALRAEGEQLARKQSAMEQSVRNAKGEARELKENLDIETDAREKETAMVNALEAEVKSLKEALSLAQKGESHSKQLEGELFAAKEESEKQRAANMVLDQELKELKDENKSLKKEVGDARAGAAIELEGESNKLRRERDDMLGDLESKLHTTERESNMREDSLRHEVSELRKRWQDAVRRAEDLSMDVQHSTAPLLRQLESTERQSRARAAAWAELETKLRSDLEEYVIQSEKLTKERNDLTASEKRSQRLLKEKEEEVVSSLETIDALSDTIETLETKVEELEEVGKRIKQELEIAERKASEGASKVRNEMLQTVIDSERRYQSQIEALEEELDGEKQRRDNLEKQLDNLAESVAAAEFSQGSAITSEDGEQSPPKEKKLRSATDQASILHDTLVGFDSDVDEDEGDDDGINQSGGSSFAAMEQLSLGLKGAKVELEALRKQLASSEETRESLLEELGGARVAVEKLPLFEQKVSDLTMEVNLKEMEIRGLQEDILDVRFLYRTQLDALLEEKMATPSPSMPLEEENGKKQLIVKIEDDSN